LLSIIGNPADWQYINFIKVSHPEVKKIAGIKPNQKYAPFGYFFDSSSEGVSYKLMNFVEEANKKKPSDRNKFDKDILKVDERVNIMYNLFQGSYISIYPDRHDDKNHKWYTPSEAMQIFQKEDSDFVRMTITNYFNQIDIALKSGDWSEADKALDFIKSYQEKAGKDVIPSQSKINLEVLYNKYKIFLNLLFVYLLLGFTLLIFEFINIATQKQRFMLIIKLLSFGLILGFLAHTFGLATRGYIAGRAPWSDGYESMIYIGWATMLAGLIFSRRTPIVLSASAILTAIIMFVAHLSWLDPQISNLVPVLKSYWLTIHVSVITASYGFFGLSALLGFLNLILMITKRYTKQPQICIPIANLSNINELSLTIGLFLLTIGTFLGGVWANESWGRYWSWDPKETWSLATILVYAFVLHLRYVPKFKFNYFVLNSASILSFYSVIMTYFGVNYLLSGMHSYAKGDGGEIPNFIYYSLIVVFGVMFVANKKKDKSKDNKIECEI
jgi:cytochrome c-type biogenesis protein CcsB